MNKLSLLAMLLAFVSQPQLALAQAGKTQILQEKGELTDKDANDTKFKTSFQKVHAVKLEAGQKVRIDLKSSVMDPYLRLLDDAGKVLAEDDDGGGNLNSRIEFKVQKTGDYKLIVTTYDGETNRPAKTGPYTLTVRLLGPLDEEGAGLIQKLKAFIGLEKDARTVYVNDVKKYFEKKGADLEMQDVELAFTIAALLKKVDATAQAVSACNDFGAALGKAADKQIARFGEKMIGAGRSMDLIGKEMALKGLTVDGKEFDWKSYRGKVVLVDFWASWCGPCIAELPNVRKNYEKYKDRGFDVVGISLDFKRESLDKFLDKHKLPWVCLFEKDAGDQGFDHPLARYYGVMGIPRAILVDRDGKVISLSARGSELGELLEKHLGPAKDKEK